MNAFHGTGVAVITPFTQNKSLSFDHIAMIDAHLMAGKVDYLVVLGSTGEAATLNLDEKYAIIDAHLQVVNGRMPIVLGAGGNDTREVCDTLEKLTKRYGKEVAGFLSVSPAYNKPSQNGIIKHYDAAANCTDLPIILYNVPGRTGSNMTAETTVRIAEKHKHIVAIKEASGNLHQMMDIIKYAPSHFSVIAGDDDLALPLIAAGGKGVISVVAHIAPFTFSSMIRAALKGDMETARKHHYDLWPLYSLAFAEGNPSSVKAILEHKNLSTPWVRMPLDEASPSFVEKSKIKAIFLP